MTTQAEAAQELLDHADRISSGELRWAPRFPNHPGECCVAFWIPPDAKPGTDGGGRTSLCTEAMDAILDVVDWVSEDAYDEDLGPIVGSWNDQKSRTQEQVMDALHRAHALLIAKESG